MIWVVVVHSINCVWFFETPKTAACQASLSFSYLFEFVQTHVHWVRNAIIQHLILCCPLLLLPSIFSSIRNFSNEMAHPIRWPKYWSFSFSFSLSSEYSGLISLGLIGVISCYPTDSQEASPAPEFESIKSLVLSLLYGPTLISIHEYWKKHRFDT